MPDIDCRAPGPSVSLTMTPDTIGRYRVTRKIGEGGMGIVYAARDERLYRPVAIKMIRESAGDARARERLWREARAAASVSHPNIRQLFEVGEENGELFIAMELMEGESLAARLLRGPLAVAEAIQIALPTLGALEALHRRGLVHRDLKPSNIFLTPHGVKLLDFGLARQVAGGTGHADATVTAAGLVMGTPAYMAPEQLLGQSVDGRGDLFSSGIVLFEMLAGKPPFSGDTGLQLAHAILYDRPPSLGGSSAIAAVDRIIQRALAKQPEDRYQTTDAIAQDLRTALLLDSGETARAHEVTRLIVLPFRILRADPETDFLAFSLPDAIASTLSGLQSLIVRSSAAALRFSSDAPDLKTIAAEADVNAVLVGSLLRAGEQIRVSTQLLEAPHGTILWSQQSQVRLRDIFELQDELRACAL
jgi:serine/threonine protein kinase